MDFIANPGDVVALVGPSGGGKSRQAGGGGKTKSTESGSGCNYQRGGNGICIRGTDGDSVSGVACSCGKQGVVISSQSLNLVCYVKPC